MSRLGDQNGPARSAVTSNGAPEGIDESLFERAPQAERRGRLASVNLRNEPDTEDPRSLMDPATKSLADAIQVTYRLLQGGMVILLILFATSGFQTVRTGETGIRVRFGQVTSDNLQPGLQPSWPFPLGQLVRLETSPPTVNLDTQFWPNLPPEERGKSAAELAGGGAGFLDPERDGSIVTSDGYVSHAKWTVKFRLTNPTLAHRAAQEGDLKRVVIAAVQRGVVHAASTMTIDDLLKGRAQDDVQSLAHRIAQKQLDDLGTGVEIEQLSLTDRMPPRQVARQFDRPQQAQTESRREEQAARQAQLSELTSTAGEAAVVILSQIDRYEELLAAGKTQEAQSVAEIVDALLQGQPVEVDGVRVNPRVDGRVPALLSEARQSRSAQVNRAKQDTELFRAVLASYKTNPRVTINREWTDAMASFLTRDTVQVWMVPQGMERFVLMLNRDPRLARDQEVAANLRRNQELIEQRQREQDRARFERSLDASSFTPSRE